MFQSGVQFKNKQWIIATWLIIALNNLCYIGISLFITFTNSIYAASCRRLNCLDLIK